MKTPKSVKLKAESQILVAKKGTQSGFSIETDMHFLSDNVIKNGSDREVYPPFGDEPKAGKKPEPVKPKPKPQTPKPKEEKKGFSWGKLFKAAVAVVAVVAVVALVVVASVATFGAGAVIGAALAGAAIGAVCSVGGTIASDIKNNKMSSPLEYLASAVKGALVGAICGAMFGPCMGFGVAAGGGALPSLAAETTGQLALNFAKTLFIGGVENSTNYALNELANLRMPSVREQLNQFKNGVLFTGLFMGGAKALETASPFVKKAFNKVSTKISDNIKAVKIAFNNMEMPKGVRLGCGLGGGDSKVMKEFLEQLKKAKKGITKGTDNASEGGYYSTEKWYDYLKEKYGEDNVYLCTDEKAIINSVSEKLEKYRKNIDGDVYAKTAVAYDGKNLDTVSKATSNSHEYKPTILTDGETFNKDMFNEILEKYNGKESVAYSKYYENTLTEDYIKNSLSDEYFTSKGVAKEDIISEMKKLTDAIDRTKKQAELEGSISRLTGNPSFEKWNVENCAEVWSVRKAILNGAKFDDISFKCVITDSGAYARPCENCKRTFNNLNNIGVKK